jgi:glycosyltransferase involved in cell wall biosynthesis
MGCVQMLYRPLRPAVATVHDLGVLVCPEDRLVINGINHRILDVQLAGLKHMDAWIADSHATAQDLITHLRCPPERVHAIHMSIDNARHRPIEDAYLALPENVRFKTDRHDVYLIYVGSELPRKNLGNLLKALKILKDSGKCPRLIKVGSAGGARWREQFARQVEALGLADDVLILGQVDEALLPLLYNAADAFVTTSVMEGFGYPLLEAMACGTPAIASRSGSLPEIGGDAPVWIDDPRDPGCIADALAHFIDTPQQRHAMRSRGLAQAARFTPEAWISQTIGVYQSVC